MTMIAKQRLFITADRARLVPEGHKDGAFLYVAPGDQIPDSAAEKFGLVDGKLKERKPGRDKEDKGGQDKGGAGRGGDNGGGQGGNEKPEADDLTKLKGVGAKTAEVFAKAGLGSFASIAAIDVASPPAVDGLSPSFDWAEVQKAAAAIVAERQAA